MPEATNSQRRSSRETATCLSVLLFWWLKKVIKSGLKRDLTEEDVYPVLSTDFSAALGEKLENNWISHLKKCARRNTRPSFSWVLFITYGRKFIFFGVFTLIEECVFRMIQVLSLGWVINSFEKQAAKTHNETMLYLGGAGIIFGALLYTLSYHWSIFSTHHLCTHMRLAMSSLIYRKTLRLSQATMRSFSAGQLITLLSSDVYRLDMQDLHFNLLWIAPAQLGLVIYLLYSYYDFQLPSLSGLALLALFVILQYVMGIYIARVRDDKISATNNRMKIITEIMNAFYHIKAYAWENAYYARAKESRRVELKHLRATMFLRILNASLSLILTKMTVFLTLLLYIYLSEDKKLDAERVFITLTLYEHVRLNFAHLFTRATVDFAEVSVTARRMTEFLLLEEKYEDPEFYDVMESPTSKCGIYMSNVSCKWHHTQETYTLEGIDLEITEGTLQAIVGPSASGKTSFLSAIMGELPISSGKLSVKGRIAYTPQNPWLFPGSILQNILFGKEYNEAWYNNVVDICGLTADFGDMVDGDQTRVVHAALSGGQKARISLARAVYSNCDIYILDEPLSCVDARLQRHIMEKCVRGALKSKVVLFVTHQLHFLEDTDNIVILHNGKIRAKGTQRQLQSRGIRFSTEMFDDEDETVVDPNVEDPLLFSQLVYRSSRKASSIIIEDIDPSHFIIKEGYEEKDIIDPSNIPASTLALNEIIVDSDKKIVPKKIGIQLFWSYLRASSSMALIITLSILCLCVQVSYSLTEYFLERWTHNEEGRPEENKLTEQQKEQRQADIMAYCMVMVALVIFSILRSFAMFKICMNASLTLFCQLLFSLLHSKARFFDTSCAGHGINRFSKDMIVIDELLPTTLYEITGLTLEIVGCIAIMCYTNEYTIIPSAVFLVFVVLLYRVYHRIAITLKRLEANARSPIYAHTAKTLEGLATIRAFEQERVFQTIFHEFQDQHTARWYMYLSMSAWLSVALDLLSLLLITSVVLIFVIGQHIDEPAEVALGIVKVIEIMILMHLAVAEVADGENEMISVERILDYSEDDNEAQWEIPKMQPPEDWPQNGNIVFDSVTVLGYGNKLLLEDVNIIIEAGDKIGVVGRSGSGKSSFINTLYRITEPTSGDIMLDGIHIRTIGLHDLRRKISIIPQVPYVFTGTLRTNIDPLQEYSDQEIWTVLDEVKLFDLVKTMDAGLDTQFQETGWHFSQGQAQLLGLARVILQKNKILCLDQATNNLDVETQQLIQQTIKEKFKNCTVISINHRLQSVMNCNKIMVIDSGRVVDYGEPYNLIKEKGPFCNLIMQLGKKNAEEIIKLAKENEIRRRASKQTQVSSIKSIQSH